MSSRSPIHHHFPTASMYSETPNQALSPSPTPHFRRARRNAGDRSPFYPVAFLRGPTSESEGVVPERGNINYDLYYDDGSGSGPRPLPASMSEFIMVSDFDRLLEQLSQLEVNGVGRFKQPRASNVAIESRTVIKITYVHVSTEFHCAVCKEQFELDCEAREMPSGAPRRISWARTGRRSQESRGLGQVFRSFVSFLGRFKSSSSRSGLDSGLRRRSRTSSVFGTSSRRDSNWNFEE
ncbi:hypothetical protein V6N12_027143 [Hibiscus sabdariffa]|uniref:DUF1117 domain-containing protein n=1 Tax=Hibiscus sabdariffa TaxID=183260 RepID=A0ABR2DTU9_9ROSI